MIKSAGQPFPPFGIGIGINTGRFTAAPSPRHLFLSKELRTAYNLGSVINPGVQRFAAFRTPEGSATSLTWERGLNETKTA